MNETMYASAYKENQATPVVPLVHSNLIQIPASVQHVGDVLRWRSIRPAMIAFLYKFSKRFYTPVFVRYFTSK